MGVTKVFFGGFGTEVNSFSPIVVGRASFERAGLYPAGRHPDVPTFFSHPLIPLRAKAAAGEVTLAEGLVGIADQGGPIPHSVYEDLKDRLLGDLEQAMPVDAVILGLHGGMITDMLDDPEGDLIENVRKIVGPDAIIGAELDCHAHLSARMVDNADVLVAFKTFPHVDMAERAQEVVDLCLSAVAGRVKPVSAAAECGMVGLYFTEKEPMATFLNEVDEYQRSNDRILSISVIHSSLWGDTSAAGTKILTIADKDGALAEKIARTLAARLAELKGKTAPPPRPLRDWLQADAGKAAAGPIVLADMADNPNGGAAGDSTFILAALLEGDCRNFALGPLWDPQAVSHCFEAGEGASLALRIGGKSGPASGRPVDVTAEVKRLAPSHVQRSTRFCADMGDCALIHLSGGTEVLLSSGRFQCFDRSLFEDLGVGLRDKRIIVVKSSQMFFESFSEIAADIQYIDTPGSLSQDMRNFSYRRLPPHLRPMDCGISNGPTEAEPAPE